VSVFHTRTANPISAKFCTDLHTNSGKVLNTRLTLPIWPPDPRVTQTPKSKQITGEKLCFTKYALNFSRAAPGPSWLIKIIKRGYCPQFDQFSEISLQNLIDSKKICVSKKLEKNCTALNLLKLITGLNQKLFMVIKKSDK